MSAAKRPLSTLVLVSTLAACLSIALVDRSPAAARIGTARELLAKHAEALGGEGAIDAVRTIVSTSEIEFRATGMKGTMTTYFAKPCYLLSEISFGFFTMTQGYDGERIWMTDANGKLQFQRDEESTGNQVTTCTIDSYRYLDPSEDIAVTLLEPDTLDGTSCEVLEIVPRGGNRCTMHINAGTFLIERLVVESTLGDVEQTFGDYRPVAGVMVPFRTTMEQTAIRQTIDINVRSIEGNVPIDPVIFLPPAQDVKDYRFAEGHSAELVPFRYHNRHIYLPVRLGVKSDEPPHKTTAPAGEPADDVLFMLDSGAGMTVLDSRMADERQLEAEGVIPGAGAGGMAEFRLVRIPPFAAAGIAFEAQRGISYPISELTERFSGIAVGGILGYGFLSRFVTRIDYEGHLISFFEPDSFVLPETAAVIDAPLIHNIFSVPATIEGTHEGTFLIDTGANQSILQRSFVEEHRLSEGRTVLEIALLGAGGEEAAALARFDSIRIGEITIPRPVLALSGSDEGIGAVEGIGGIIGNDILEQFTVTLDYRNQRVLLEKNARFGEPMLRDRSGMGLSSDEEGGIVVHLVIPGTPADRAGIRAGDLIESIDGASAAEYGDLDEIAAVFEGAPGTELRLIIRRGGETKRVTIVLDSYL